jgi:hypothetical protein
MALPQYTSLGDKLDRLLRHDGGKRKELCADAEAARVAATAAAAVRPTPPSPPTRTGSPDVMMLPSLLMLIFPR